MLYLCSLNLEADILEYFFKLSKILAFKLLAISWWFVWAPPKGSLTIPSIIPKWSKSSEEIFKASAAVAAREESLQRIDEKPYGEITV